MIQSRGFNLIGRHIGLSACGHTYPPQPPGNEAKAKELAARAKALIAKYKSLFAVNVKPIHGVGAITAGGGPGGSGATAAPSSALVFLDSLEDAAAGPPVTNEPSP